MGRNSLEYGQCRLKLARQYEARYGRTLSDLDKRNLGIRGFQKGGIVYADEGRWIDQEDHRGTLGTPQANGGRRSQSSRAFGGKEMVAYASNGLFMPELIGLNQENNTIKIE